MRNPKNLTHAELADLVARIQDWMYLDIVADADAYNPEKAWDTSDIAMHISELLAEYGLVPAVCGDAPEPCESVRDCLVSTSQKARKE